ncbi:hypothetical protein [Ardenticatena maritima]|nr:hypothetical protein [Ardenticatena maritima]
MQRQVRYVWVLVWVLVSLVGIGCQAAVSSEGAPVADTGATRGGEVASSSVAVTLSPTAALTPTEAVPPSPTALPTPTVPPATPTPVTIDDVSVGLWEKFPAEIAGQLTFSDTAPMYVQLSGDVVYFTPGNPGHGGVSRYNIQTGELEQEIVAPLFETSEIAFGKARNGWVLLYDVGMFEEEFPWVVRVLREETGEVYDVLAVSDRSSWPGPAYDFDGRTVALAYYVDDEEANCGPVYLMTVEVESWEQQIVETHCDYYGPFLWWVVAVEGDILVGQKNFPDSEGGGSTLQMFERDAEGKWVPRDFPVHLPYGSMPRFFGDWLVWKDANNWVASSRLRLYNWKDQREYKVHFETLVPETVQMCGDWLLWKAVEAGGESLRLYNLKTERYYRLYTPRFIGDYKCNEKWLVWSEGEDSPGYPRDKYGLPLWWVWVKWAPMPSS